MIKEGIRELVRWSIAIDLGQWEGLQGGAATISGDQRHSRLHQTQAVSQVKFAMRIRRASMRA